MTAIFALVGKKDGICIRTKGFDKGKKKNKVVLNLTKRQLLCLSIAAAMGLPFYFFTKDWIGTSNAATGMVILMVPAFLFAMYEKDGMPLEKILFHIIQVKLQRPAVRKYEIENFYEKEENLQTERKKKGGKPDGRQNG
nr:PrgI family protein [Mediterraneibacter gnavus]